MELHHDIQKLVIQDTRRLVLAFLCRRAVLRKVTSTVSLALRVMCRYVQQCCCYQLHHTFERTTKTTKHTKACSKILTRKYPSVTSYVHMVQNKGLILSPQAVTALCSTLP